ncbi:response regulator [Legionella jordanis]|uniref:Two component sensor and regulator histidine kinase response regulator n=1 Tax=Legionella jordanis TaxID=456 RepID=A0A0W0VD65_9GAMM|nr:response regulator [Legionella jordanis]KTD18031.1 two component sensor and regulator histidine kinase response regulator [Legionella jordanis]RMX02282.1 response regulator [Legionella jordanis]RMX21233.1 response regulator [Legionella jordanis]VEH13877.1 two component sensor and regulator, histidine kinase response regulator [Legionella jordanis]
MRVLIVEDNAFNAFCLTRLLTISNKQIQPIVVENSIQALSYLEENDASFVIMDGDLGASDGIYCNGPALVEMIWQQHPSIAIVVWSDSESMRHAFEDVFRKYNKPLNDYTCWTKVVSQERIRQSLTYLTGESSNSFFLENQLKSPEHRLPAA